MRWAIETLREDCSPWHLWFIKKNSPLKTNLANTLQIIFYSQPDFAWPSRYLPDWWQTSLCWWPSTTWMWRYRTRWLNLWGCRNTRSHQAPLRHSPWNCRFYRAPVWKRKSLRSNFFLFFEHWTGSQESENWVLERNVREKLSQQCYRLY